MKHAASIHVPQSIRQVYTNMFRDGGLLIDILTAKRAKGMDCRLQDQDVVCLGFSPTLRGPGACTSSGLGRWASTLHVQDSTHSSYGENML